MDPSRNVDQAFRATVLQLLDGRTLVGLQLREEGQVVVLADNTGKEVSIPKKEIEEKRISALSPMPANFAEKMTEPEFQNLLGYLLSQRQK